MVRRVLQGTLVVLLSLWGMSQALMAQEALEEDEAFFEEGATTLKGEMIDPSRYLREGRHGFEAGHRMDGADDGGQMLALLEEGTGMIYLFLAGEPGQDPNELIHEYAGRPISVTGPVYTRGNLRGIVPVSVESIEGTPITAPEDEGETPDGMDPTAESPAIP